MLFYNLLFIQHIFPNSFMTGNVYHEGCNCPVPRMETWMKHMNCQQHYSQIKNDLSRYPAIDMNKLRQEYIQRFNNRGRHSLCHYVVKDNKVFENTIIKRFKKLNLNLKSETFPHFNVLYEIKGCKQKDIRFKT